MHKRNIKPTKSDNPCIARQQRLSLLKRTFFPSKTCFVKKKQKTFVFDSILCFFKKAFHGAKRTRNKLRQIVLVRALLKRTVAGCQLTHPLNRQGCLLYPPHTHPKGWVFFFIGFSRSRTPKIKAAWLC